MKIATRVAVFHIYLVTSASCGLNTNGLGDEEDFVPDVVPDETQPDVSETADNEATGEDAAEEVRDEVPDESQLNESVDAADVEEVEDTAGDEGDGEAEDGEAIDPCAPPEIPSVGVYLFYCLNDDSRFDMTLWRWVDRLGEPDIVWGVEPGCATRGSRTLWCELSFYNGGWEFNIELSGSECGWSCCGPGTSAPYGMPRLWRNGTEILVENVPNYDGTGCNHSFRL